MMSTNTMQCRLCLKQTSLYYSLFTENLAEIVQSFTFIKINKDEKLPSTCCSQCLRDLYFVHKVRRRIIASDKILRERAVRIPQRNAEIQSVIPQTIKLEEVQVASTIVKQEADDPLHVRQSNDIVSIIPLEKKVQKPAFTCSTCDMEFETKTLHIKHMLTHSSFTKVCTICGAQVSASNFTKHLGIHKGTPQICELCGAVAKNVESLRGHMFYMHKSTAEQYKCKDCGQCFRYKYKFALHMRKNHGGERTHVCHVCGKAFYTLRDVTRHIKMTHLKLRPYICQYCNKGFSSSYAKLTHERQHTNEKPFKCEVCAEGFRQRVSLKTHLKSKHGITQITEKNIITEAQQSVE